MQENDFFSEKQPNARTVWSTLSGVCGAEKTPKQLRLLLFRYADARIFDDKCDVVLVFFELDMHCRAGF